MGNKMFRNAVALGVAIAQIRNSFFYKDLLAFLKGDDENSGSMYFCNLKPLYDKYGYATVNEAILDLDKKDTNKEANNE